jgi:exosortase
MINARLALILFALACWDGWRLLAHRISDGSVALPLAALSAGIIFAWIRIGKQRQITAIPLIGILAVYTFLTLLAPPIIRIAIAVIGLVLILHQASGRNRPPFALIGLAMLALPILPTLDFYLSWPMRRVSAILSAGLLKFNGFDVTVDGAAINWQGQLLLFDGACSGVRMLWASLILTSFLALIGRLSLMRYGLALIATILCATFANALRASSLFFVETGFLPQLKGPVMHEMIGVAAFAMLGLSLFFAFRWQEEKMPSCA